MLLNGSLGVGLLAGRSLILIGCLSHSQRRSDGRVEYSILWESVVVVEQC